MSVSGGSSVILFSSSACERHLYLLRDANDNILRVLRIWRLHLDKHCHTDAYNYTHPHKPSPDSTLMATWLLNSEFLCSPFLCYSALALALVPFGYAVVWWYPHYGPNLSGVRASVSPWPMETQESQQNPGSWLWSYVIIKWPDSNCERLYIIILTVHLFLQC